MFPSLAARETYVAETNFAARKRKKFLPEVKNIFVSRTKLLRPQHMFPNLATMKTMLISFQCRSPIKVFPSNGELTVKKLKQGKRKKRGRKGKELER